MKKLLLFVLFAGFGFLPLWASIILVQKGAHAPYVSADYWNTAPWLIMFSVPFCGITLAIAGITVAVYKANSENPSRGLLLSTLAFAGLIGLAIAVGKAYLLQRGVQKDVLENEQRLAIEFTKADPRVVQAAGGVPDVSVYVTSVKGNVPSRYILGATAPGQKDVYPIVDVKGTPEHPTFVLDCITRVNPFELDAYKDKCSPGNGTEVFDSRR